MAFNSENYNSLLEGINSTISTLGAAGATISGIVGSFQGNNPQINAQHLGSTMSNTDSVSSWLKWLVPIIGILGGFLLVKKLL